MIAAWLTAAVLVVAFAVVRARRRPPATGVALAHTTRLAATRRFRVLRRRHLIATAGRVTGAVLVLVGVIGVTARPTSSTEVPVENQTRDVLLCLDVSGSMDEANVEILETFAELARSLQGDRIGLVIFDAVAVPKFPLTDDVDYVLDELDEGARSIRQFDLSWLRATFSPGGSASSLLADGLAACTQRFDRPDEDRPRSIVYATDNSPQGEQLFTLEEAFALAADADIRVYGINPFSYADSFEALTESTGGRYWQFDDVDLVDGIVADILSQEAARMDDTPPDVVVHDEPGAWIVVAGVGVATSLAAGRRRVR